MWGCENNLQTTLFFPLGPVLLVFIIIIIIILIIIIIISAMAAVQAMNVHALFLFMGDLNGHHYEWLCATTTNRLCVAASDFVTVSGCDQLVTGPLMHGILDLLMTDVHDLAWVSVVAPLGRLDHSSLSAAISMAQAIHNLCVSRTVLEKHGVTRTAVCDALGELPWRSI